MKNDKLEEKTHIKKEELKKIINNDINTTKEDESFITDEVIQYCSSPNTGLVSINRSNSVNNKFTPSPSEKSFITNTVTMNIALIKKEICSVEKDRLSIKSSMFCKNENDNENKDVFENHRLIYNKNRIIKCKSIFSGSKKEKHFHQSEKLKCYSNTPKHSLNRGSFNTFNIEINKKPLNKKISKIKKKRKNRKSKENFEENKKQDRRLSLGIENENKQKKKKKKKSKKNMNKTKYKDELSKNEKGKEYDLSSNIIILDFSSTENNDDSEDSYKKNKSVKEKENKKKYNQTDDEENKKFISTKNKKKDMSEYNYTSLKAKQSCYINSSFKISQTKILHKSTKRKMTSKSIVDVNKAKIMIKSKSNCPKIFSKEKEKKNNNIFNIFITKNYCKNNEEEKPIRIRYSISKNISKVNQSQEKMKKKIKHKDSIQSCKNLNKKYKHMINHNFENEKYNKKKEEKEKENINFKNKSNKNLFRKTINKLTNTNIRTIDKNAFKSNRNLTKITINPKTAENKDIHLVFEGKQETIINYTNQEMVDDENEYMVECLKILLKLKKEEQPRCKQKVNFNFPAEENNKKIALFDLDETLVHCTKEQKGLNGDTVTIKLPTNKIVQVGLNIRSHWKEALDLIKNLYHIVVYTASHQSYADAVLNYLDKDNKYFQYRLYRNHCVQCDVDGMKFYVKDLDTLNKYYNIKDVVLIDNSVLSFAYHLNNGIPIVPFIEQKDDTQLLMLAYYLVSIASFDDLTQENKKHINIEHFLLMAKKLADEETEEEEYNKDDDNKKKNQENNKENGEEKNNNINNNNNDILIKKNNEIKNENNNDNNKKLVTKNLLVKQSEKALKIAQDMKKNLGDIYNKNYN